MSKSVLLFSRSQHLRIGLTGIFASISLICLSYNLVYPLELSEFSYLHQVPIIYWGALVIGICSILLLAYTRKSQIVVILASIAFWLLINSRSLLYYQLLMPDSTSISYYTHIILQSSNIFSINGGDYFGYLQWPLHFIFTKVISLVIVPEISDVVKTGYLSYTILFPIVSCYFVILYTDANKTYTQTIQSLSYLIFAFLVVNNQFVPQFMGLIYLFTLFSIRKNKEIKFKFLMVLLFIPLILSHPFIWVFYIGAIVLTPVIYSLKQLIIQLNSNYRLYDVLSMGFSELGQVIKKFPRQVINSTVTNSSIRNLIFTGCIYTSALLYQFVYFPQEILYVVLTTSPNSNVSPLNIVYRITPGPLQNLLPAAWEVSGSMNAEVVLLHSLVSLELYQAVRAATLLTVLAIFTIYIISYFTDYIKDIDEMPTSMSLFSVFYFLIGSGISILGARAMQIGLLPLVISSKLIRHKKTILVVLTILIVISPLLMVNSMVNRSLSGGNNAGDLETSVAGEWLQSHSGVEVIQRRGNLQPILWEDEIQPLDQYLNQSSRPSPAIIVYSPIVQHRIDYLGYQCELTARDGNIIYDNNAKGLLIENDDIIDKC